MMDKACWRKKLSFLFCLALIATFVPPPVHAGECVCSCKSSLQEEQDGLKAYRALLETDGELASVEQEYAKAAERFSALFADDTQDYIGWFFKETSRLRSGVAGFGAECIDRKRFRDFYIKRRLNITAYMNQVIARRADSSLFPLLHALSVLFWVDPLTFDNPVPLKGDYADIRSLPGGAQRLKLTEYGYAYEIYPFSDQTWAMIRQPSPRTDFALVRFKDGKISFGTVPNISVEDFYRSGEASFTPSTIDEKEAAAEVEGCSMTPVLQVETGNIPFIVKAELRQHFSPNEISYICIPECSIPFVWTGAGYRQGEKTCLEQGRWGVFSPFRGNNLARVDDAYRAFLQTDKRLIAHEQKLALVSKAFADLFSDDAQPFLDSFLQRRRMQQQMGLQIWIDDQESFVEILLEQDQPVIAYMELVIELARKPDARLLYALDPLHDALGWFNARAKGLDEEALRILYPAATTGESGLAWLVEIANTVRGQKSADDGEEYSCGRTVSLKGIKGGDTLIYKETANGCDDSSYSVKRSYILHKAADGALWGESVIDSKEFWGEQSRIADKARYVTLIGQGKIHLLTPGLPAPKAFFQDGESGLALLEPSTEEEQGCSLRPVLEMDTSRIPFRPKAVLLQTDAKASPDMPLCVAQCAYSYRWDAAELRYKQDAPLCLGKGAWGKTARE